MWHNFTWECKEIFEEQELGEISISRDGNAFATIDISENFLAIWVFNAVEGTTNFPWDLYERTC